MAQAPRWTEQEFESLVQNPSLSDEALAAQLPQRTAGAVGWVRNGIHSYHTGKHYESILSKMMQRRLDGETVAVCARCGETVR